MAITTNRCKLLGELVATATAPMILTLLFFALHETLTDFGAIYLISLGAVAIVVMINAPKCVWDLIHDLFNLELFPLSYLVRVSHTDKGT